MKPIITSETVGEHRAAADWLIPGSGFSASQGACGPCGPSVPSRASRWCPLETGRRRAPGEAETSAQWWRTCGTRAAAGTQSPLGHGTEVTPAAEHE